MKRTTCVSTRQQEMYDLYTLLYTTTPILIKHDPNNHMHSLLSIWIVDSELSVHEDRLGRIGIICKVLRTPFKLTC